MSAIPKEFIKKTDRLSADVTRALPASKKIYVQGSRPDIQVAMREVAQSRTSSKLGAEDNPSITLYDTSGPYTDPRPPISISCAACSRCARPGSRNAMIPRCSSAPR